MSALLLFILFMTVPQWLAIYVLCGRVERLEDDKRRRDASL